MVDGATGKPVLDPFFFPTLATYLREAVARSVEVCPGLVHVIVHYCVYHCPYFFFRAFLRLVMPHSPMSRRHVAPETRLSRCPHESRDAVIPQNAAQLRTIVLGTVAIVRWVCLCWGGLGYGQCMLRTLLGCHLHAYCIRCCLSPVCEFVAAVCSRLLPCCRQIFIRNVCFVLVFFCCNAVDVCCPYGAAILHQKPLVPSCAPTAAIGYGPSRSSGASSLRQSCSVISLKDFEDSERKRLAFIWAGFAESLSPYSEMESARVAPKQLGHLFLDKSPATLRRHLCGWRAWLSSCLSVGWCAGSPKLGQLVDFLESLAEGAKVDRGKHRVRSAMSVLTACSFAAYRFQLSSLKTCLTSLVEAWRKADKWSKTAPPEAVPLPLRVVKKLEEALKTECGKDSWILCCILLMVWCSLRWSDCQRVQVDTISKSEDIMAGCSATVRDRSRPTARPRAGPRGRLRAQPAAPAALTQDRA